MTYFFNGAGMIASTLTTRKDDCIMWLDFLRLGKGIVEEYGEWGVAAIRGKGREGRKIWWNEWVFDKGILGFRSK
ncbi:histidine kinase [Sesbania bispinosa]|nr:histidine kinase [Sesbania bispinosa]